jgi:hypothetical protein
MRQTIYPLHNYSLTCEIYLVKLVDIDGHGTMLFSKMEKIVWNFNIKNPNPTSVYQQCHHEVDLGIPINKNIKTQ